MELNSIVDKFIQIAQCSSTKMYFEIGKKLPSSVVQCNSMASFKNKLDYFFLYFEVYSVSFSVMVAA